MVITVTDPIDTTCTRVLTISGDVDCPTTCTSPALSIGGTTCAADGGAFYTINFTAAATAGGATAVTVTDAAGRPNSRNCSRCSSRNHHRNSIRNRCYCISNTIWLYQYTRNSSSSSRLSSMYITNIYSRHPNMCS